MKVGLCYESVLPARGGCEHYISDLARRLARDGHEVHLFACRWDESALPASTIYHRIPSPGGIRFLRPWRFAKATLEALQANPVDVSMGFDKTYGQDILYPQGGLHQASRAQNLLKHPPLERIGARLTRLFDPTSYSFARLERRQYLSGDKPLVLVNSHMVQRHFRDYLGYPESGVRVLYSAIDPERFSAPDREVRRVAERKTWGVDEQTPVGLMVAMNYRLKGLPSLIQSLPYLPKDFVGKIVVVGAAKYGRYEQLAKKLGVADRIKFLGFRSDPKDAFFAADYLVHPTFYDPCSLVALEAMACGLPVITTQFNGASELLTPPEDGLVIDNPHHHQALAGAIADMSRLDQLPARQAKARQAAQHCTFDDHYRDLLAVLTEVANRRRSA
jgi:UDP-glucose:(heptosyl)LPS alpha-1,3-glucosyltransferase